MFRITKVFENETVSLYKVEGKLTDEVSAALNAELDALKKNDGRQAILDMSQVYFLGPMVQRKLIADGDWYLLNCSMEFRNRLMASGHGKRILG